MFTWELFSVTEHMKSDTDEKQRTRKMDRNPKKFKSKSSKTKQEKDQEKDSKKFIPKKKRFQETYSKSATRRVKRSIRLLRDPNREIVTQH